VGTSGWKPAFLTQGFAEIDQSSIGEVPTLCSGDGADGCAGGAATCAGGLLAPGWTGAT
jgi:hypothetical protein